MPWVDEDLCVGCGICVDECYPGAIALQDEGIASIDDDACIRCGVCHSVCPEDAVRHDSELIPQEVEANLSWARELLAHEYYSDSVERQAGLVKRLGRHFAKEKRVAEQTMVRLEDLIRSAEG